MIVILGSGLSSCRHDDIVFIPEEIDVYTPEFTDIDGFYLLNEGNMGSNKSTLDYYDYRTGVYTRNIYGNANPDVPKELGDVGNDLEIYGSRLYAVINASNKVEVMDARTAGRIGHVNIPNCRSVAFHNGYAYITSYAGPIEINPDYRQRGYVAKVDTVTLEVVATCLVGFQPDGIAVADGKLYVANSGGYMVPNYENTVSVIDIASFREEERITLGINLNHVVCDSHGHLWVSSRGDYYDDVSKLYCYDIRKRRLERTYDIAVGDMCLSRDYMYVVGTGWNYITMSDSPEYTKIDVRTLEEQRSGFITDGTETDIKIPYGVAVNPITDDIYVTDARNYVNPGYLHCYSKDGQKKWSVRTGDIPAHFVFIGKYR